MKQGWEIKKLGEVCTFCSGYTPKESELLECGAVPYFKVSDMNHCDNLKYLTHTSLFLEDGCKVYPKHTIVFPKNGAAISTNKKRILAQDSVVDLNTGGVVANDALVYFEYLYLYFLNLDFRLHTRRGAVPTLDIAELKNKSIPVPPREEQERIVAELDCLSGVIERKREQLKQLDALAQSIFYQMFGDPITNEKGWEVCELQKVSTLLNGRAYKQNELLDEGKYKVLRVGNFFTNSNYYYSDLELEPEKYCDDGDLLFAWSASFGAFIWNGGKVIYHYHIWKVLYDHQKLNIDYYRFLLNTMTSYFMKDVHGIGMVHLTKAGMEQYILPIPPLTLQQQFADKIEAIEKQKELIKQSITQTEELFNSRMDYYFN